MTPGSPKRAQRPIARPTHLNNTDTSHLHHVDDERENQRDNDTDRYELAAQSRQVAGRPNELPGLEAHRQKRPTRLRSPKKAPVPEQPTLRPKPDGPSEEHFHAANGRCAGDTRAETRFGTGMTSMVTYSPV